MSMTLEKEEFTTALRRYVVFCKQGLPEILNRKLLYIARGALRLTPQAFRPQIEADLGIIGYRVSRSKKTGQFKRRGAIIGGKLVYLIINSRRGKAGKKGLYGPAMTRAVRRFIGRRLSAVGSLKAGWIKPIRALATKLREGFQIDAGPRVKQSGVVRPARDGWNPVAELEYRVTVKKGAVTMIDPRVEEALKQAFRDETRSMNEYIIRKMQIPADQINAK